MVETASRMSATRRRQSLVGNNRLGENAITQLRLEGSRRDQIHSVSDQLTELSLKAHELEKTNGTIELDQQIDVAVATTFVPCKRAEQRESSDAKRLPDRAPGAERVQNVISSGCG